MSSQPFNIGEIVTVSKPYYSTQEEVRILGLDSTKAVVQSNYGPFTVDIKYINKTVKTTSKQTP